MVQQVTAGVKVMVESFYQPGHSNPVNSDFLFSYRITIENLTEHPLKLLTRHWHILDSIGTHREVEGEGVVGQQPVIMPGNSYEYTSAASLQSDIGKMYGTYLFANLITKKRVTVTIPEFQLLVPAKMN